MKDLYSAQAHLQMCPEFTCHKRKSEKGTKPADIPASGESLFTTAVPEFTENILNGIPSSISSLLPPTPKAPVLDSEMDLLQINQIRKRQNPEKPVRKNKTNKTNINHECENVTTPLDGNYSLAECLWAPQ